MQNKNKDIFLDYNSTNRAYPEIFREMETYTRHPMNPSSVHRFGQEARKHFRDLSKRIADHFRVHPLDLIFTSGATEANNLAMLGSLKKRWAERGEGAVYLSCTNHDSVMRMKKPIEALGFKVRELPVVSTQQPVLDIDWAKEAFQKEKPLMVAFEWVSNEFGVIQPLEALYQLADPYKSFIHVDAVQSFGRIPTDVKPFPNASFAFSGHKYGGMGGHGLLIKPHNLHLEPMIVGGSQQNNMRAGTVSIPLVAAQVYCMLRYESERLQRYEHTSSLQSYLEDALLQVFRDKHPGEILGKEVSRNPNTTMFRLAGVNAETLMMHFDVNGIMLSTGSACSSGSIDPSSGLLRIGFDGMQAAEFIRVSSSEHNSQEEMELFLKSLDHFIETARS